MMTGTLALCTTAHMPAVHCSSLLCDREEHACRENFLDGWFVVQQRVKGYWRSLFKVARVPCLGLFYRSLHDTFLTMTLLAPASLALWYVLSAGSDDACCALSRARTLRLPK